MTQYIVPKKSLGQNFLKDKNIAKKIVSLLDCREGDHIVEIGPGMGALTVFLLDQTANITAVEIDKRSVEYLMNQFPKQNHSNFNLVPGDIREFKINELSCAAGKRIKVIGNIPYNVSADIFFWLFQNSKYVEKAVLMVQKEVAARLSAKPRTKDYGILSLALSITGKAATKFDVPPGCFYPQPKVTSSIVEIKFNRDSTEPNYYKAYLSMVKSAFNQRRKTLRNSLKTYIESKLNIKIDDFIGSLSEEKRYFSMRAEELTKEDFIILLNLIILHSDS